MNFGNATDIRMGQNTISALYFKNRKIWPRNPEEIYLVLTSEEDNNSFYINLNANNLGSSAVTIEVSYDDGKHWQTFTSAAGSTNIGTINSGERICIRGLNDTYTFTNSNLAVVNYNYFSSDGKFKASGNIMGLIYGKDADIYGTSLPNNVRYNFFKLFYNSKVTDISNLKMPATTLTEGCYGSMFANCDELERAYNFELPAITLSDYCYGNMFENCDNLLDAPALPATTLTKGCYQYIFAGCGKLNCIKMLATDISATGCLEHWVGDVAPTGIFVKDFNLTSIPINSVNGIPVGWVYEEANVPDFKAVELTIQSSVANNTITYSGSDIEYLYYKIGDEANTYEDFPAAGVTINADEKLILRGELSTVLGTFASTGNFRVFGNIQSLNFTSSSSIACTGGLFKNCTGLTDARYLILSQATVPLKGYFEMFKGCTSLITAPKIEATKFGNGSLQRMFSGCTSLTTIRPFTIDSYAYYVCSNMFENCTSLTIVPEIIINYAGYYTNQYMFSGCRNLIDASRIKMPTNIEDRYAFYYMFASCNNLKKVPVLPATKMEPHCYQGMFSFCSSLTEAPVLPATTLAPYCYEGMFLACSSLTEAPVLPATTLVPHCYESMFLDCPHLNYIKCLATDISAENCTNGWTTTVAPSGTFVKDKNMADWLIDSANGIPVGWTVPDAIDYSTIHLTLTAYEADTEFTFMPHDRSEGDSFEYSTDSGNTWNQSGVYTVDNPFTITTSGSFRLRSTSWRSYIESSSRFLVRGNVMSLLYEDDFVGQTTLKTDYQFEFLFDGADIGDIYLPATTLTPHCYEGMFFRCKFINNIPELPATTLAPYCYASMFERSNITNTPVLHATILAEGCYKEMFEDCSSLVNFPALPATTLAPYCYAAMFFGCESLVNAGYVLGALTAADHCYAGMFGNCTNLRTAPTLLCTTLAPYCYASMFANCVFLPTSPQLPVTTLAEGCYQYMFVGCKYMTSGTNLPATTLAPHCYEGMFKGCDRMANASQLLPSTAIDLSEYCFSEMFMNCENLVNVPVWYPNSLRTGCYASMFRNCTSLTTPPHARVYCGGFVDNCYNYMYFNCNSMTSIDLSTLPSSFSTRFNRGWFGSIPFIRIYLSQSGWERYFSSQSSKHTEKTAPLMGSTTNSLDDWEWPIIFHVAVAS